MRPIDVFLSHADKDKVIAKNLAKALTKYDFRVFVAHDDIGIGEEWEQTLKDKINDSELFVALLSDNFHRAHYTDHEIGIAIAHNKRIFPLRIDQIKPYGFMSKFQAKKISSEIRKEEMEDLARRLVLFANEGKQIIDKIIEEFSNADSYIDANNAAQYLFGFSDFTPVQIDRIAEAFLSNDQINGGWTSSAMCLDFFAQNWDNIKKEKQNKLQRYYQSSPT